MANQHPYLSPTLPFMGCIQGGLFEGKSVTVTGRVLPGAERFCVNLQCNTPSDVALHFNPRYTGNSGTVVCNTLQNSRWGSAQRSKHTPLPRGFEFILTFLVNRDSYSVIVNGAHFLEYLHRLPVSGVNTIYVDGGVEITSITFQNPTAPLPHSSLPAYVIPYKTIIQGGLYPGRGVTVRGCVNHNADRFCINLRYASDVALHFNPRFDQNVVVRNSLMKECWGPEERSGCMPFYRGQPFAVSITCDTQCYRIAVNGVQMFTYNHRYFPFQQINVLEVDGNISISSVTV